MRLYDRLGVVADWDPATRTVHVGPTQDPIYDAENARLLLGAFDRLIDQGGPITIIGRGRGAEAVTFGYALKWMDFLKRRRGQVRLIVYDLPPALHTLGRLVEWTAGDAIVFVRDEAEAWEHAARHARAPSAR